MLEDKFGRDPIKRVEIRIKMTRACHSGWKISSNSRGNSFWAVRISQQRDQDVVAIIGNAHVWVGLAVNFTIIAIKNNNLGLASWLKIRVK